jgi:hypothetical protein
LYADRGPGGCGGFWACANTELFVDALEVFLDGSRRDPHLGGGLRGGVAEGYEAQGLGFSWGEAEAA